MYRCFFYLEKKNDLDSAEKILNRFEECFKAKHPECKELEEYAKFEERSFANSELYDNLELIQLAFYLEMKGIYRSKQEKYALAESRHSNASLILSILYGKNSIHYARSIHNLIICKIKQKSTTDFRPDFKTIMKILKKKKAHYEVGLTYRDLANYLYVKKKPETIARSIEVCLQGYEYVKSNKLKSLEPKLSTPVFHIKALHPEKLLFQDQDIKSKYQIYENDINNAKDLEEGHPYKILLDYNHCFFNSQEISFERITKIEQSLKQIKEKDSLAKELESSLESIYWKNLDLLISKEGKKQESDEQLDQHIRNYGLITKNSNNEGAFYSKLGGQQENINALFACKNFNLARDAFVTSNNTNGIEMMNYNILLMNIKLGVDPKKVSEAFRKLSEQTSNSQMKENISKILEALSSNDL